MKKLLLCAVLSLLGCAKSNDLVLSLDKPPSLEIIYDCRLSIYNAAYGVECSFSNIGKYPEEICVNVIAVKDEEIDRNNLCSGYLYPKETSISKAYFRGDSYTKLKRVCNSDLELCSFKTYISTDK